MTKPAVAQICLTHSWGGLEMNSIKYSRYFKDAGFESHCIFLENSPIHEQVKKESFHGHALNGGGYFSPGLSVKLHLLLKEKNIKALYCHYLKDLWLIWPALWGLPDVKLIGFARMFLRDTNKKDFGHKLIYGRLDHLIALSHIQKKFLLECLPVPQEKYVVIPNGVDTVKQQPRSPSPELRKSLGAKENDVLVGLVGRFDPMKGQMELVQAAQKVISRFPNVHFTLIGDDTANEASIRPLLLELRTSLKLDDKVTFLPGRTDIPAVLNALDVFVMPSYEENFSNVLLEAMASGTMSIGTNAGGTPEIIDDKVSGLLVEPKSSESLADGILKVLESPELRQKLAAGARQKAVDVFDVKRVFERAAQLAMP